jgi:cell division protein FtsI/penicillin-binding protein 2
VYIDEQDKTSSLTSKRQLRSFRCIIFFQFFLIAVFLVLISRCFYLQLNRNGHYSAICDSQNGFIVQQPQRGAILDSRARLLVASNKVNTIFVEPRRIKNPEKTAVLLAPVLKVEAREIYQNIINAKNPGFLRIKVDADFDQCENAKKIKGVNVISEWRRNYVAGRLASHVVGFTSADNRGLGGIELQYDQKLRGKEGKTFFTADISRRPIKPNPDSFRSNDGVGIILTIDSTIQEFARSELIKRFEEYEAESAMAIVAEPKTGAILAMVSIPDFDPAQVGKTDPNYFLNHAINDQFEPGSILKPIVMAIGLDTGAVNTNDTIFCEDGFYHGKGFGSIREYRYYKYGTLSMRNILVKSSNIGMAKIGQKLGKERLYNGLKLFGFGSKTGLDLAGETSGVLWPTRTWTGYSLTRIPFGQEITTTGIQIVRAYCILANGGKAVQPYLVKAVVDNDGEIVQLEKPPVGIGYVISPEVAKWIVTEALVGVVEEGTGKRAKLEKWKVFGKTGTANIAKEDEKGYSMDNYVASFVAGAPAEDPKIIVLVSIRKPNKSLGKGYAGGAVASPVAAKIIEKTLTYLEKNPY